MKNQYFRPTTFEDHGDDTYSVVTHQETTPILEQNKDMQKSYGDKLTPGKQKHGTRVASIPFGIWEQWKKDTNGAIEKDPKLLAKYLNDPDNKYFRTTPTRV
tara:strand:+ start:718 stop:1023 length:306 start_codon:yes stop_codon:yes gene_type:complete